LVARPTNPLTGKRSPKYFDNKEDAQKFITWARGKSREQLYGETLSLSDSDKQKHLLDLALSKCNGDAQRVLDLVLHGLSTIAELKAGSVRDVLDLWYAARNHETKEDGTPISQRTLQDCRSRMRYLGKYFGDQQLRTVTEAQLHGFIDSLKGKGESVLDRDHHENLF
jgi:hypothetical protein